MRWQAFKSHAATKQLEKAILTANMDPATDKTALIKAAEDFLATAKKFDGDPVARTELTKKADDLRRYSEDAGGALFRQWDTV